MKKKKESCGSKKSKQDNNLGQSIEKLQIQKEALRKILENVNHNPKK